MKKIKYDIEKKTLTNLDSEEEPYAEELVEEISDNERKKLKEWK